MILVVLAIVAATAIGATAEHRFGAAAQRFSRAVIDFMVWALLPFIVFFVVARLHFGGGVGIGLALGFVELSIVGLIAAVVGTKVLKLPRPSVGSLILLVILGNTGYFGVPVVAALLGHDALAPAIAWDSIVSQLMLYVAGFGVGAAYGTEAGDTPRQRLRAFLTRNPVLWAIIAALVVPNALAPEAIVDVARFMAAYAVLPLGFFILGVNLMAEREDGVFGFPPPLTAPVGVAIALRLAVAPALLLLLALPLTDIPDAYLLQAAMPSGINALIVGHLYGTDLRLSSSGIVWTSIFALAIALAASPFI
ncbi:AEC family transporter [Baekduia sp. Peel2402]|uniref:AEC family transporter n=1 Tax=Baekduia sp. Peel2402 TaxID=3458296 RepID=UPI00403E83E1